MKDYGTPLASRWLMNLGSILALAVNGLALYEGVKRILPKKPKKCLRPDGDVWMWNMAILSGESPEGAKYWGSMLAEESKQNRRLIAKTVMVSMASGKINAYQELFAYLQKAVPNFDGKMLSEIYFHNFLRHRDSLIF